MSGATIRLAARRSYDTSSVVRRGVLFISRINRRMLYIGWDPNPGVRSNRFQMELADPEAIKLRDYLIEQFPLTAEDSITCTVCGKLMGPICDRCA